MADRTPDLPTHSRRGASSAHGVGGPEGGAGGPGTGSSPGWPGGGSGWPGSPSGLRGTAAQPDAPSTRRAHLAHQAAERAAREASDAGVQARKARLRRRQNLLLWSSPLMVLALVVVGKALSVPVVANAASEDFDAQSYAEAADGYHRLQTWNVAEQWKVFFNEGTSVLAAGDLDPAVSLLDEALAAAPALPEDVSSLSAEDAGALPACLVRANLSVAHEMRAEVAHLAADALVVEMTAAQEALAALGPDGPTDGSAAPDPEPFRLEAIATYLEAEELYRTANSVRVEGGCPDDDESRQRAVDRETEAREKREALEDPPPPEDGGGGEDDQADPPPEGEEGEPPPDPAEQERREQLEQRAEDAERERQQTEDYTDGGDPFDPGTPQW
jgi:tetratricopeptide (TPR) repeat protein